MPMETKHSIAKTSTTGALVASSGLVPGGSVPVPPVGAAELIVTHDGPFHADEACAVAMLEELPRFHSAKIERSRDPKVWTRATMLVDVGGVYDPATDRYDHHQSSFADTFSPQHKTKLSSAGLVYKHYGRMVIARVHSRIRRQLQLDEPADESSMAITAAATTAAANGASEKPSMDERLWLRVYATFIEALDGHDNGMPRLPPDIKPAYAETASLAGRVARLNPTFLETSVTDKERMVRFREAVELCRAEFSAVVRDAVLEEAAKSTIEEAFAKRDLKRRLIEFPRFVPYERHLFHLEHPVPASPPPTQPTQTDTKTAATVAPLLTTTMAEMRTGLNEMSARLEKVEMSGRQFREAMRTVTFPPDTKVSLSGDSRPVSEMMSHVRANDNEKEPKTATKKDTGATPSPKTDAALADDGKTLLSAPNDGVLQTLRSAADSPSTERLLSVSTMVRQRIAEIRAEQKTLTDELEVCVQWADRLSHRLSIDDTKVPKDSGVVPSPAEAELLYAIFPSVASSSPKWTVRALAVRPGSMICRKPLPEPWRGLSGAAAAAKTGVAGTVFVHANGFIGGAKTRDDALSLVDLALNHPQ